MCVLCTTCRHIYIYTCPVAVAIAVATVMHAVVITGGLYKSVNWVGGICDVMGWNRPPPLDVMGGRGLVRHEGGIYFISSPVNYDRMCL